MTAPRPSADHQQQAAEDVRTAVEAAGQIAVNEMAFDWYCPSDERLPRVNCRPCVAEVVTAGVWPVVAAALDRAAADAEQRLRERMEALADKWLAHAKRTADEDDLSARAWWDASFILRAALHAPPLAGPHDEGKPHA